MWKNKHVVIALIVAPILSILAWFAVGQLAGEKPTAAEPGSSYKLVARSNCRYASGSCDLHNADFQLTIEPDMLTASSVALTMTSSHALQGAALGLVESSTAEGEPSPMTPSGNDGMRWQGLIPRPASSDQRIRVAVIAQGATWYAEVPVIFLEETE